MKKQTSKVGIFGLIGNLFLLIIKLIFGYLFNSQAMIADAINSATDCISSFIIIIGGKISVRPKTVKHNVGHGKAEYLFSMFVSLIMIFLSIKIVIDGVISIIHEDKVIFSFLLVVVCFITIITKIFLYLYAKKIYKKENSVLVKSAMIDHRNDCLITTLTLTSIILSYLNLHWANGLFGIFIAFYIFKEGITIFEESYRVLVDTSLDTQSRKKIFKLIDDVEGVVKSDNLATIPIGDKYIAIVTIWVCGELSTAESHRIADRLKKQIEKEMPIIEDVFVHVHPDEK